MSNIYEWLFDHYALPKLRNIELDHTAAEDAFAECVNLNETERMHLNDMVSCMRLEWGACAFALGIQFALQMQFTSAHTRKPGWLLYFLS